MLIGMSLSPWKWKPISGIECKIFYAGIFRHQNWRESCWNNFFLYAPTHTFDEKKTRNSNSQKKILGARPENLVRVQNWEKIIARTAKIRFELWGKISQPSEGVGSPDLDTKRMLDDTFRKSENLTWIFTILIFSGIRFQWIQSDRSHWLERVERAVWTGGKTTVSILVFFW